SACAGGAAPASAFTGGRSGFSSSSTATAFSRTIRPRPSANRRNGFCKKRLNGRIAMGGSKYTSPPRARRSTSLLPPSMGTEASRAVTEIIGCVRSGRRLRRSLKRAATTRQWRRRMEIESERTHDVYDGHSTRGVQAIGGSSVGKIEMEAYRNTPLEQERISDLMNIIPKGHDSVLDVGARDGYLTRLLTEYFASVTALDLEKPSIAHDRITCVEGDVTRLELASDAFDVVLCAEVLEHIPGKGLEQACRELSRVAKSHVVIGVPYRQDTRLGRTTCQSCGRGNPPWGHVNVFDERRLTELFLPLQKVGVTFVGSIRSRTNALSSWLVDVAWNPWGTYDQEEACIHCGQEIGRPAERNLAQKLCSRLAFSLNAAQSRFISARPNWIHMVFEKHRQIGSRRHSLEQSASSVR